MTSSYRVKDLFMYYVVAGEPKPKVYREASAARKACVLASWRVETFGTLEEAGARRKELLAGEKKRGEKRGREGGATEVVSQREFERMTGVKEEEDQEGLGRWLHGQMGQGGSGLHRPEEARRRREEDAAWFREYEERKKRKQDSRDRRQNDREKKKKKKKTHWEHHTPSSSLPPSLSAAFRTLKLEPQATWEQIKKSHKVSVLFFSFLAPIFSSPARQLLILAHHPDKHPESKREEQTALFREVQEAYEQLKAVFQPR